jgi:PAS domain S-box-containing protein
MVGDYGWSESCYLGVGNLNLIPAKRKRLDGERRWIAYGRATALNSGGKLYQVNDTAILTSVPACEGPEIRPAGAKHALPWAALLALVCFAVPVAVSVFANKLLAQTWPLGLATAAVLAPLVARLAFWRRNWARRLEALEGQLRTMRAESAAWQSQLADSRKTEEAAAKALAQARTQLTELSAQLPILQAELESRKRAESKLSQQRLQLESSKTVLKMHVEASTVELQKLQNRYELILNCAGEGICGLDAQGKVAFVNPAVAKITGRPLAELIGKTEQEIFRSDGANGHAESPDFDSGEQVFLRKDGTRFPVEFVRTKIEEHGRQTGAVLIFKDITERKRAEETLSQKAAELARSNAELEQFAFVASHDLQEPLRKILAFGDRLKAKLDQALAAEPREYLDRMQNAATRMRTLIDDLLAFSRVMRRTEPFELVDLAKITREILGDLEVRIEKTAARVEVGDLPTIEADATQMRQLLMNLIGNALKFQHPDVQPLVKVQGRTTSSISGEQFCQLTVEDNGIGFEQQYAEKIFVVFQRLHGRGEYEGTGVGLAVCRRIADRHQGTIVAQGKPGQGAIFTVMLPVHQSKPKPPNE